MANTDSRLLVADLDFTAIRNNLVNFLKGQSQFSDYNFSGSGLSILVDLLAYNTHMQAFYLNMISNEMFLDSALMRDSVVSHAKLLGYTPRSTASSKAIVNLFVSPTAAYAYGTLSIPRFTQFISGVINGQIYTFVNLEQVTVTSNVANGTFGTFEFYDLNLYEGTPQTQVFTYDGTNTKQEFILPNSGIDTRTMEVRVQTSSQDTTYQVFTLSSDATTVSNTAPVYYLNEYNSGYKIYFGDNIIGKALDVGNIVIVSYLTSSGSAPNGANSFTLGQTLIPGAVNVVGVVQNAAGGTEIESNDSVKFSAPKNYGSQNRAVTTDDYINLLNQKYPYFEAISVWGGEQQNPPQYGKVFISAKPKNGYYLTATEKDLITKSILAPFNVLTVIPEIVDPDYAFLNINAAVRYNPNKLRYSTGDLIVLISNAIYTYALNNLNTFNSTFELSQILRQIDDSDVSILSSDMTLYLEKRFLPPSTPQDITINFGVPIVRSAASQINSIVSSPSFQLYDSSNVFRNVSIEEVPQSYSGVDSIVVTNSGSGYTETPTVTITGDGTGAAAIATVVNGKINSITLTSRGTNYSTATVTLTGGNSTGATAEASAVIHGEYGTLRTFFYDENGTKKILNSNAGTVDHIKGTVTLTNFNPVSVSSSDGLIRLHAAPSSLTVSSNNNTILTLDSGDTSAVLVSLIPVS